MRATDSVLKISCHINPYRYGLVHHRRNFEHFSTKNMYFLKLLSNFYAVIRVMQYFFFKIDVGQHEAAVCGAAVRHRVCEGGDRGP